MTSDLKQNWWVMVSLVMPLAGYAQSLPLVPLPIPPTVQVVAVPEGANIQASGNGFSALDFGHVSWAQDGQAWGFGRKKDNGSFGVSTRIGVRVDCGATGVGRLTSVRAFVNQPDPHYRVFLDGAMLGTSAMNINSVPCGATVEHTFEVNVPVKAPAGPLNVVLVFEVGLQ